MSEGLSVQSVREMEFVGKAARMFTTTEEDLRAWDGRDFKLSPILAAAELAVAVYAPPDVFAGAVPIGTGARRAVVLTERAEVIEGEDAAVRLRPGNASRGKVQVGVSWSPDLIAVSVQGSKDGADWLDDAASAWRVAWPEILPDGCRIGWGFKRQAEKIGPVLAALLRELLRLFPRAVVYIQGHSLGGALAPILAVYLVQKWELPVRIIVPLEAPRPGNEAFADFYDAHYMSGPVAQTWSVVNVRDGVADIVTRLPKKSWGARHVARARRIILDRGAVLFGEDAWQAYRTKHPVSSRVAAWRIVTRFARRSASAIRAHFGAALVEDLRAMRKASTRWFCWRYLEVPEDQEVPPYGVEVELAEDRREAAPGERWERIDDAAELAAELDRCLQYRAKGAEFGRNRWAPSVLAEVTERHGDVWRLAVRHDPCLS